MVDRLVREAPGPDPLVIHIQPVEHVHLIRYLVYFGSVLLIADPTPTPYIDSANLLLSLGYSGGRQLFMRRRGVNVNQLAYTLAEAARLEVENQANPPFPWALQQDGPGSVP